MATRPPPPLTTTTSTSTTLQTKSRRKRATVSSHSMVLVVSFLSQDDNSLSLCAQTLGLWRWVQNSVRLDVRRAYRFPLCYQPIVVTVGFDDGHRHYRWCVVISLVTFFFVVVVVCNGSRANDWQFNGYRIKEKRGFRQSVRELWSSNNLLVG